MTNKNKSQKPDGPPSSPFLLVQSTTGRHFNRAALRFSADMPSVVDGREIGHERYEQIVRSHGNGLSVRVISADEAAEIISNEPKAAPPDAAKLAADVERLELENAALRDEVEDLRRSNAFLKRRNEKVDVPPPPSSTPSPPPGVGIPSSSPEVIQPTTTKPPASSEK